MEEVTWRKVPCLHDVNLQEKVTWDSRRRGQILVK